MARIDHGLAFMLQFENVAWYEHGTVRILDRRIYPIREQFVVCKDYREVAQAIRDMVTQSAGPFYAAAMGMVLAAYQAKDMADPMAFMQEAAHVLSHARPTTVTRMKNITDDCLAAAHKALCSGADLVEGVRQYAVSMMEFRYENIQRNAQHLVDLFPDKGVVLTQCFAETIIGMMIRESQQRGKQIELICPETRPFLQGARLTASVARDQNCPVTVITDNMPGFAIRQKHVDLFTTGTDAICMDGHVVNKVGTFQIALACKYFGVPYYVTGSPDRGCPTIDSVHIEERDPEESVHFLGTRTAKEGVRGWYPAFDITPPELVTAVVTDKGAFAPDKLADYFADEEEGAFRVARA